MLRAMGSWKRRPYFGQFFFVGIAAFLTALLSSNDHWAATSLGITFFGPLCACAGACLVHGIFPAIATWWIATGTFTALCSIMAIALVHSHMFVSHVLPGKSSKHLISSLAILITFFGTGMVALVHFRRTMLGNTS